MLLRSVTNGGRKYKVWVSEKIRDQFHGLLEYYRTRERGVKNKANTREMKIQKEIRKSKLRSKCMLVNRSNVM